MRTKISKIMFIAVSFTVWAGFVYAEDTAKPVDASPASTATAQTETKAPAPEAPVVVAAPSTVAAPVVAPSAPVSTAVETTAAPAADTAKAGEAKPGEAEISDNLEFVSGEVTAADEATKTVTVKLYGDTEAEPKEKSLSVKVDETTDITDGEKDRDFKSLAAGTEVDVEYDPASNKATYIFVY